MRDARLSSAVGVQVSSKESLLLPSPVANGVLPLRIQPLHEVVDSPAALTALLQRHRWVPMLEAGCAAPSAAACASNHAQADG